MRPPPSNAPRSVAFVAAVAFFTAAAASSSSPFFLLRPPLSAFALAWTAVPRPRPSPRTSSSSARRGGVVVSVLPRSATPPDDDEGRRSFLVRSCSAALAGFAVVPTGEEGRFPVPAALAEDDVGGPAIVTDRVYLDLKGLPPPSDSSSDVGGGGGVDRIAIGLYGKSSPQPTSILKSLFDSSPGGGLPAKCKPLETRTLQREQLEANKVYNSCVASETEGVTYDYGTVWRVDRNRRIDLGAVSGKFVSRVNPTFEGGNNDLRHDSKGVVSVRSGDDGGFGFTIYPGGGDASDLDEDNVVVGKVIQGMDVVDRLNDLPVVKSSDLNYMALTGAKKGGKDAPSRACRYGGPMYCNELKPLKKVLIVNTGVL